MKQFTPQYLDELRARVPLAEVIGQRVRLVRRGREYDGLCPFHNEKTPSFTVVEDKGFFHCFGCGTHGDVIAFIRHIDNLTFREAVEHLAGGVGLEAPEGFDIEAAYAKHPPTSPRSSAPTEDERRRIDGARALWHRAKPTEGTPVEAYLRARRITIPIPPTIRYLADAKHGPSGLILPALVAAVQGPDRVMRGVLRIFLTTDGTRKAPVTKAKMMLGKCAGGAVRLGPAGPRLAIAEGLETALSVVQAYSDLPVWAALSTGGIRGLILPPEVEEAIIYADRGTAGLDAAVCAARQFSAEGRKTEIISPPAGIDDFNTLLQAGATT